MAKPKVFVSHSHVDDAFAGRLVKDLSAAGADAWLDKEQLGAGDFQERISEALDKCEWFVLVLTQDALASNWVRQEVHAANSLKHQGRIHDLIFIKAGLVDHRDVPALWNVYNIFDATLDYGNVQSRMLKTLGLSPHLQPAVRQQAPQPARAPAVAPQPAQPDPRMVRFQELRRQRFARENALPARLAELGYTWQTRGGVEWTIPPLVTVAAGPFLMGSDPKRDAVARENDWAKTEMPQHWVEVFAFRFGKYPVTVAEYALAVRAGGVREPPEISPGMPWHKTWQMQLQRLDHPIVGVLWQDANAYIAWLRKMTGQPGWRLPTEAQWEKAARWDPRANVSRIYPWGDRFDKARCNVDEPNDGHIIPVGSYPANMPASGASPCGAEDMAGNVYEWTSSLYLPYPYIENDGREDQKND